jgi:hypothetical protein
MDRFTFAGCIVSLDMSEAVSQLITGVSAVARWCDDLIALDSSAGIGHAITSCSVKLDLDLINSSHVDHAWAETCYVKFKNSFLLKQIFKIKYGPTHKILDPSLLNNSCDIPMVCISAGHGVGGPYLICQYTVTPSLGHH